MICWRRTIHVGRGKKTCIIYTALLVMNVAIVRNRMPTTKQQSSPPPGAAPSLNMESTNLAVFAAIERDDAGRDARNARYEGINTCQSCQAVKLFLFASRGM